tara:strand:+ start:220 stop:1386 length:1167 start_codon:yes stop_codon:yes gene_type:complete
LQQSILDDWFLRQDILHQLMSQDEDEYEAELYADRIMRIAQEDSAEHQILTDPFDRSVALVLSLVKDEGMDPWNIDLSAFLKLFTKRVKQEASGLDLPACGRLIRMSWEVLTEQASTLFDRVIALDTEEEEDFYDFGWESEYDDEEFIFTTTILEGNADVHLPGLFGERVRREEGRPSTLGELLSALKDACDEAEILKTKEEFRKAHAEELKNMLDNVGSRMHNEDMEGDIRRCWAAMRKVTSREGVSKVLVSDVTIELQNILIATFGEIPEGYEIESKITSFVSGLFLTHRGYAWISQDGPDDPIMLEDRWPNAESFEEASNLAEKLIADDYESMQSGETESMRHAARLEERARKALEEEQERKRLQEMEEISSLSESENPLDWLVE